MTKVYYDICQEKILSGKDLPCYEKKDAACKGKDADCLRCKCFIGAVSNALKK